MFAKWVPPGGVPVLLSSGLGQVVGLVGLLAGLGRGFGS